MSSASDRSTTRSSSSRLAMARSFMSEHRNVAARTELVALGLEPTLIRSWVNTDRLVRLFRGVYSFGRDVETRESCWRAGLLVAGPGSALTGRTALELWGAVRPARRAIPFSIEVATARDRSAVHAGLSPALAGTKVKVLRRRIEPGDLRTKEGLALLRAPLALIDFAIRASATEVRFAFLELCRLDLFQARDVSFCFDRATGRRGASKVKPLLGLWVRELGRVRSVFEGLYLLEWVERRLEMPEVNVKVFGREVDFFWRESMFALELDGGAFHSDPVARRRDVEKSRYLQSRGVRVVRITWKEFAANPDDAIERIARALGLT